MLQPTFRRFLRELDEAPGGNNLQYIYYSVLVFWFLHSLVTRVCTMKSRWEAMGGTLESYVRGPLIVCFCNLFVYTIILDLFACSFLSWSQYSWAALSLFPTGLFSRHSLFSKSVSICLQGGSKNGKIHSLREDVFLVTWRSWVMLLLHWDAGRLGRGGASWEGLLFTHYLLGSHWIIGLLTLNLLNQIVACLVVESRKRFAGGIDASISRA